MSPAAKQIIADIKKILQDELTAIEEEE